MRIIPGNEIHSKSEETFVDEKQRREEISSTIYKELHLGEKERPTDRQIAEDRRSGKGI